MAYVSLSRLLWLLFIITTVSATQQYALSDDDAISKLPYICRGEVNMTESTLPYCCSHPPICWWDSKCGLNRTINATDAKELMGTVSVVLGYDSVVPIRALASLNTRRNYIISTLVDSLGLDDAVQELPCVDVHSIEIFSRHVTITTFVPLSIGVGIDNNVLSDKIFEIIPDQKSADENHTMPDLVLSLNFLLDAGALAINQAIFTTNASSWTGVQAGWD